jgi:predicted N-acyltransferase
MKNEIDSESNDYVIRVLNSPLEVSASAWNQLLFAQRHATPFMRHEFLCALHTSGCATAATGWTPKFFLLERGGKLEAACVLYIKSHSQGEFVFDWGWARAYQQHGLSYHPKAVCAVPFIPVRGSRLLAHTAADRVALVHYLLGWCAQQQLSGLHGLFASDADLTAFQQAGMMLRHTVQFHWQNTSPGYASFDAFLATLTRDKRKKIQQERRKVVDAGVHFRVAQGTDITPADWDFFYQCYERTYLEHNNAPYLNRDFFARMANTMPQDWLLFTALKNGQPIAASLVAINVSSVSANSLISPEPIARVAYGRYWGTLEQVDCLHFEACYYQPLNWCIANGYGCFEGGAQGEHKLARALLPVKTTSAHWLAHPGFASAVNDFLCAEDLHVAQYLDQLKQHSPYKAVQGTPATSQTGK